MGVVAKMTVVATLSSRVGRFCLKSSAEKPPTSNSKLSSLCCPRDLLALQRERTPRVAAAGASSHLLLTQGGSPRSVENMVRTLDDVIPNSTFSRSKPNFSYRFIERFDPGWGGHDLGAQSQQVCCSTTLINGHHRKCTKEAIC
jgi:hypothetical protein